jgi:enoyl-CoA hydratase/carnithine racemase
VIHLEERGWVGLATIDRPERRNALNQEVCAALDDWLTSHAQLRAIVITGAGTAFCSGADLVTRFASDAGESTDTFRPSFERLLDAINNHPAPVIAAINGPAIGAGMQLAVGCDLRIAALGARLSIPAGRLGIHLSGSNIWRLASLVGQGMARDFLLAGRSVTAEEALACRLVERLATDALAEALVVAGEIAALAPLTVQGHKRALNLVAEATWPSKRSRDAISRLEAGAFASADLQEGLTAFEEKRNPDFRGE